jgi:hypothetical protein
MNRSAAVRAAVLEASLVPVGLPPVPDRDELLALLGEAARGGSVSAMRTLLAERYAGVTEAPRSVIDELASRRASTSDTEDSEGIPA